MPYQPLLQCPRQQRLWAFRGRRAEQRGSQDVLHPPLLQAQVRGKDAVGLPGLHTPQQPAHGYLQDIACIFRYQRSADLLPGEQLVGEHLLSHQVEDHLFGGAFVDCEVDFNGQWRKGTPDTTHGLVQHVVAYVS